MADLVFLRSLHAVLAPQAAVVPPRDLKTPLPSLEELLAAHQTDAALFTMFQSMRAPYDVLDVCKAEMEGELTRFFSHFYLVARGSLSTQTALKGTADLDLDLILPRTNPLFVPELIDEQAAQAAVTDGHSQGFHRAQLFQQRVQQIHDVLTRKTFHSKPPPFSSTPACHSLSRSLPLERYIHGMTVSIDLFPKLVRTDGAIVTLGAKEADGGRQWLPIKPKLEHRWQKRPELTTDAECAVLLVKHWKAHRKSNSDINQKWDALEKRVSTKKELLVMPANNVLRTLPGEEFPVAPEGLAGIPEHLLKMLVGPHAEYIAAKQELEALKQQVESMQLPKGYHIGLAMERVLEEHQLQAADPTVQAAGAAPAPLCFSRARVLSYVRSLVSYLTEAYTEGSQDNPRFRFPDVLPNASCFIADTTPETRTAVRVALTNLSNALPQPTAAAE